MKLRLDNTIWIRYTSFGYMGGMKQVIELRKDFFIREASFSFGEEAEFNDWVRIDTKEEKQLLQHLKKVDFLSLKDEYINHDIMDGGESCFEIYDNPLTKEITMINYYETDDTYINSLRKVVDDLYSFVRTNLHN